MRWTRPERAAASTFSVPLMRLPARASIPSLSSAVWRRAASVSSPRSAGTLRAWVLKARWRAGLSLPLALAASSSSREMPIQAPRPGARARTSGATMPSGPSASLISSSRLPFRRVRTHVLSGTCGSDFATARSTFRGIRIGGLLGIVGNLGRLFVLEPVSAGGHDDLVTLLFGEAVVREDPAFVLWPVARLAPARLDALFLNELVGREVGKVVQGADVRLTERHQHLLGEVRDLRERILDAQLAALFTSCCFAALERFGGSALELGCDIFVKAFDRADLLDRDVGDFLEAGETLGDEQLGEGLVDVELVLEHLRALDELALALLARIGLRQNVDLRGRQLARKPHVLAPAADRKAQLVVGNDDFDPAFFLVDDNPADGRRLKCIDDKGREVLRPGNDVDLLALELLDHRLDPAALHPDAGSDGIDRTVVA